MEMESQNTDREALISLAEKNKELNGIPFGKQDEKAGFSKGFLYNVVRGSVKVKPVHIKMLLDAYPELDPEFNFESYNDKVKRLEQENLEMREQIKEIQAAIFRLQNKDK